MTTINQWEYSGKELEAMSFAKNYHKWILDEFRPYLGRSVAEVGGGVGSFSKLILETKIHSLTSFEPSKNMYPLLKKAICHDKRAHAINEFFSDDYKGNQFDTIFYVNVLEHIKDDANELSNAQRALIPGGHLLIFAPALPWLYSDFDWQVGHFRRYVKKDLVRLTKNLDLSITKAKYFDIAGITPWYINFVLLKKSIGSKSVSIYDNLVVPVTRSLEKIITPPVGKNVLLVAKNIAESS